MKTVGFLLICCAAIAGCADDPEVMCGDGIVSTEGDEACDDGNTDNGDGCSADCQSDEACGNGIVDSGETCDDGNTTSGDACSETCQSEFCGNSRIDSGEVCDDGNATSGDGCSANCSSDESCGNAITELAEQCDDGNAIDGDGCTACVIDAYCGDGILDAVEGCDDGNNVNFDGCTISCAIEATCGDGNLDAGEECDDGNAISGDQCSVWCLLESFFDDFESGVLRPEWWQSSGNAWSVESAPGINGAFSARSGQIIHNQSSILELSVDCGPSGGSVSFVAQTATEPDFDFLRFRVDGAGGSDWSGFTGPTVESFPLGAGVHALRWGYFKDGSVNTFSDKVLIDDVITSSCMVVLQ